MNDVHFKPRRHAQAILMWATLILFLVILLVGCGGDGGQADPNGSSDVSHSGGVEGVDKQVIETYDSNVEVQKVEVGGIDCVVAVRNDQSGVALSCVSADGSTSSGYTSEGDE